MHHCNTILSVKFSNPTASYLAGGVVSGQVIVTTQIPREVTGVSLLLKGNGQVLLEARRMWHDTATRGYRYFEAKENYVSQKFSLAGDGHNLIALAKGVTSIPFAFTLPSNLPSSITSHLGFVSYSVEAEMRQPSSPKPDIIKSIPFPFTVNAVVDLNTNSGASLQPQQVKQVKKRSSFVSFRNNNGQETGFEVKISRSGYLPGEIVDFGFEIINNNSNNSDNRKVSSLQASLHQITKFTAQGRSEMVTRRVAKLKSQQVVVEGGTRCEMWKPGSFRVPNLPPTTTTTTERGEIICRMIDVQYFLRFEMSMGGGLRSNLVGELPIIIGTVPLRKNNLDNLGPATLITLPQYTEAENDDFSRLMPSVPILIEDDPDLSPPPPTYAEAISTMTGNLKLQQERSDNLL